MPLYTCPLCLTECTNIFFQKKERFFLRCKNCSLIFLDPKQRLSPEVEEDRYGLHENNPEDPRYRKFLRRLADPLIEILKPGAFGLDFGCGPGPTMHLILQEKGFSCKNWDPFFYTDDSALTVQYDYITMSEVAEHLHSPLTVFQNLNDLLHPGGILGIMTSLFSNELEFKSWQYKEDPTHVCFFSKETFEWLIKNFNYTLEYSNSSVWILRKG